MYKGPLEAPLAVLCARVAEGCAKDSNGRPIMAKDGQGWIHDIRKNGWKPQPHHVSPRKLLPPTPPQIDFDPMLDEFEGNLRPGEVAALATELGVAATSLARLEIGWCRKYVNTITGEEKGVSAWTFPMRNARDAVVGFRFRSRKGAKWAMQTSINGLFIPRLMAGTGPLLILEGPTDVAAALTLGFDAIGRPSNTAGREMIVEYLRRRPRRDVCIVRNADAIGSDAERLTRGAVGVLAEDLLAAIVVKSLRIIAPPVKDLRAWLNAGVTKRTIEKIIEFAPPRVWDTKGRAA